MKRGGVLLTTADIIPSPTQILAEPWFAAIRLAILYGSYRGTGTWDSGGLTVNSDNDLAQSAESVASNRSGVYR